MTCRVCKSGVQQIVDLGNVPLANDFDTKGGYHPLRFGICQSCGLLQVMDDVPPEQMFVEYPWVSGTSRTMQQYAKEFADFVGRDHNKNATVPFALEIASNDGLLLGELKECGFVVLGVDPSSAANIANKKGLLTVRDFFGESTAKSIASESGKADVVIARNVVGHVNDPVDLVLGIDAVLTEEGDVYIESPYAGLLRDQLQYDTIFHEHFSYLTITTLANLLDRIDLKIASLGWSPMNGGSFVVKAQRKMRSHCEAAVAVMALEKMTKLNSFDGWKAFGLSVYRQSAELRAILDVCGPVAAYGAAAKFMTMLSVCHLGTESITMVADDNPMKHGKHCPGTNIPVVSCDELIRSRPSHVLIGAWNYEKEIIDRLLASGYCGEFISSLPIPRVL